MSQLLEDIASPISDSTPSGEDIARLSPSPENEDWIRNYSELRELTKKVVSNCDAIVALSQKILTDKSKDLRIAGHLCMGLLHQKGFTGFDEGLKGYQILLEQYWDNGLYPSRDAARTSNIKSLDTRLAKDIVARTGDKEYFVSASAADAEAMESIKDTAEAIKAVLSEKSPERAASMDELVRAVEARRRELGAVAKKPEPIPKASAAQKVTGPPAEKAAADQPAAEEAAIGTIGNEVEAIKAVVQAAGFLLKKDPKNVASYRLLRSSLWYSLSLFSPEPNRTGKRVTQYLPPVGKSDLEQLLKDEDWELLVTQCESVFTAKFESGSGGCFCLDIQRFLSTALKELIKKVAEEGDSKTKQAYEIVNKTILQETAILVERYPWITDLFYSNETPFVDSQTKNWIEKSVKPVLGTASSVQQNVAAASAPQISEDFEKAADLLAREKFGEAVDLMQSGIDAEATCKGLFQRRLNLANLCLDAGKPAMARPLLEQLDEDIERFSLDQWEPGLCVQVWNHLKRCYQELTQEQESDSIYKEQADRIFEKICRLDIRAAVISEG